MPKPVIKFCPQCGETLIIALRGGKERLICPDERCGYIFWDNPVPVVAAIVERRDHIVLVQSHGWPKSWYGLITGFLEKEETPEEAVVREVKEEIGLEARLQAFIGTYPFFRMNQLILAYHLIAQDGEINLDTEELSGYKEVAVNKIQPWPTGTGFALRDWLKARGYEPEFIQLKL